MNRSLPLQALGSPFTDYWLFSTVVIVTFVKDIYLCNAWCMRLVFMSGMQAWLFMASIHGQWSHLLWTISAPGWCIRLVAHGWKSLLVYMVKPHDWCSWLLCCSLLYVVGVMIDTQGQCLWLYAWSKHMVSMCDCCMWLMILLATMWLVLMTSVWGWCSCLLCVVIICGWCS